MKVNGGCVIRCKPLIARGGGLQQPPEGVEIKKFSRARGIAPMCLKGSTSPTLPCPWQLKHWKCHTGELHICSNRAANSTKHQTETIQEKYQRTTYSKTAKTLAKSV